MAANHNEELVRQQRRLEELHELHYRKMLAEQADKQFEGWFNLCCTVQGTILLDWGPSLISYHDSLFFLFIAGRTAFLLRLGRERTQRLAVLENLYLKLKVCMPFTLIKATYERQSPCTCIQIAMLLIGISFNEM